MTQFSYSSLGLFEAYDSELKALGEEITLNLENFEKNNGGPAILKQCDPLLSQCDELIKQMEVEIRSSSSGSNGSTRKQFQDQINERRKLILDWKNSVAKAKQKSYSQPTSNSSFSLSTTHSALHQDRMSSANDRLQRQNDLILSATQSINETENLGMEICTELGRNREKIMSTREKTLEFLNMSDTGRRIVSSISRRDQYQRYIIYLVLAVLLISIILLIYLSTKK